MCMCSDINATRLAEEHIIRTAGYMHYDFSLFNKFIDNNILFYLSLCGRNFAWYHGDDLSITRLDIFFLSEDCACIDPTVFKLLCLEVCLTFAQSL